MDIDAIDRAWDTMQEQDMLAEEARRYAVEQQDAIHRVEMSLVAKNRPNRAVAGAESHERHAIHAYRLSRRGGKLSINRDEQ